MILRVELEMREETEEGATGWDGLRWALWRAKFNRARSSRQLRTEPPPTIPTTPSPARGELKELE